ncbi:hypothetical protein GCM10023175_03500 [Pseudonocardia xishanensis]|uniref:HNH endonuclease n=1 Tax=Pseudonocardia xishanensis TaxID=630995 RepID=A0ABP8REG7_9PSEU
MEIQVLADLIRSRDRGRCTEPHCDAPIQHLDHLHRWSEGGATTLDNGVGKCTFHNLVRESPTDAVYLYRSCYVGIVIPVRGVEKS